MYTGNHGHSVIGKLNTTAHYIMQPSSLAPEIRGTADQSNPTPHAPHAIPCG